MIDLIPVPIHWIAIADNHVPEDTLCLVEYVNTDGDCDVGVAYKSHRTKHWTMGEEFALEERHHVLRYAIITDSNGMSWQAPVN